MDSTNAYFGQIKKSNPLTREQERDASTEDLVKHNLKLVISIAKRYSGRGLELQDLIQEGNIGLMTAANKFKPEMGNKFSTYATCWIKQAISLAIKNQSKTIRVPVHANDDFNKIRTTSRELAQKLDRDPTPEEISKELDLTIDKVNELIEVFTSNQPVSIDSLVEDGSGHDFLEDKAQLSPNEVAILRSLKESIEEALSILTKREQDIIRLRFGLDSGKDLPLKEVGLHFGITQERVRQIESKALGKIKKSHRTRGLKDFTEAS